jgi:glycosyltransferase involved in cell wall biosynthesis
MPQTSAMKPPRVTYEPPEIAVVTPSFQMAGFLRETIESVLAQGWPRLDYLVMDGGSRDGTRELLESYSDRIRWVSEPDGGQADAINRGFSRTRGTIFAFLNADDTYRRGALAAAAAGFDANPGAAVVYGDADIVDAAGDTVLPYPTESFDRSRLNHTCPLSQPAAFIRRDAWEEVGGLDANLRYALDYDLWIRLSERHALARIPGTLASSRMHAANKSLGERGGLYRESVEVVRRHFGYVPMSWLEQYGRYLVDRVDQLYEHSDPSRRSRAMALALGVRHNHPRELRRFWRDWQADGVTGRFRDGWMSKVYTSRHDIPPAERRLVVAGRHEAYVRRPLVLKVSVAGRTLGRVVVRRRGEFEQGFELPRELTGQCEIRIVSAWTWRPGGAHGDNRRLSCRIDRVEFAS